MPNKKPSIFKPDTYYTIHLLLHNPAHNGKRILVFSDQKEKLETFRDEIYIKGMTYVDQETCIIEVIPPFNINQITISPQIDKKITADCPIKVSE